MWLKVEVEPSLDVVVPANVRPLDTNVLVGRRKRKEEMNLVRSNQLVNGLLSDIVLVDFLGTTKGAISIFQITQEL